jgi:hypothetical protein
MIGALLDRWGLVIGATAAAVPLCVLAVVVMARRRTAGGMPAERAWRWSAAEVAIVLGTAPWTWMALTALGGPEGISLVPFRDLLEQVRGDPGEAFVQIFANMVFLLPFGALAPLRWPWFAGLGRLFAVAAAYSATIEVVQHAGHLGRISSVDDVLQNAAGAVLGGLLTLAWWPARKERPSEVVESR